MLIFSILIFTIFFKLVIVSGDCFTIRIEKVILPQSYRDFAPGVTVVVPAGHVVYDFFPTPSTYVPSGAASHGANPVDEYFPGLQSSTKELCLLIVVESCLYIIILFLYYEDASKSSLRKYLIELNRIDISIVLCCHVFLAERKLA